jgi:hypothetical protein
VQTWDLNLIEINAKSFVYTFEIYLGDTSLRCNPAYSVSAGKPVAAQLGGVSALAQAGLLRGKKYASIEQGPSPAFGGAIYSGTGVVKDGLILTSGICPYMARARKLKDGTEELTLALVETMKAKM